MEKKERYKRNLPHIQIRGQTFFVTYLLYNAIPNRLIMKLSIDSEHIELKLKQTSKNIKEDLYKEREKYFKRFDNTLHSIKKGMHWLKQDKLAKVVADSLQFWDNKRIDLISYCIMSNHVHAVFDVFECNENNEPLYLQDIMESIKKYSAKKCNEILGRKGQFWQHESYDRLVRNREELYRTICYVLDNPIKAGLCENRADWKWSYIKPDYNEFI